MIKNDLVYKFLGWDKDDSANEIIIHQKIKLNNTGSWNDDYANENYKKNKCFSQNEENRLQ